MLEAYRNRDIHPVPVKTTSQHTVTALHRMRSMWLEARTSRINTARGLLREMGIFIPTGARHVVQRVCALVEDAESAIPDVLRASLHEGGMCLEIRQLEARMRQAERELEAIARQMPVVVRLRSIPGVGLLTATAHRPEIRLQFRPAVANE